MATQGVRLRLTSAGYRIDELASTDGLYITWEGLYTTKQAAADKVELVRPDIDRERLLQDVVRQEN